MLGLASSPPPAALTTWCSLLGRVALAEGSYDEAEERLRQSIAAYEEWGSPGDKGADLVLQSYAVHELGRADVTRQLLREALLLIVEGSGFLDRLALLSRVALLLVDQGQPERAVDLYALASRYPYVANSRWFEDVAGRHIAAVAASLPPGTVAAAQERGRARDLETTVAELLEELSERV